MYIMVSSKLSQNQKKKVKATKIVEKKNGM